MAAEVRGSVLISRLASAAALASVLSITLSGVAAADNASGTRGHHKFNDEATAAGATCRYVETSPTLFDIYRMVMKSPLVWWPNRNSSITTEHGRVGWRAIVKYNPGGTWRTLLKTPIQYATAYEDQLSPYGSSTDAPFTSIRANISASSLSSASALRVSVKAFWFRTDGSILGWSTHDVDWYRVIQGTVVAGTIEGSCPRYFADE